MSSDRTPFNPHLPAPCIVDSGTVVNKQDMRRLLCDLGPVQYRYTQGDHCVSEGEGYVVEVFSDPNEATLVTNHSLYLNICSFDYLELSKLPVVSEQSQTSLNSPTSSLTPTSKALSKRSLEQASNHPEEKHLEKEKSLQERNNDIAPHALSPLQNACFKLIQEQTVLQLIPLSNPLKSRQGRTTSVALDAVVADMLSTNLELSDDDDCFPF